MTIPALMVPPFGYEAFEAQLVFWDKNWMAMKKKDMYPNQAILIHWEDIQGLHAHRNVHYELLGISNFSSYKIFVPLIALLLILIQAIATLCLEFYPIPN